MTIEKYNILEDKKGALVVIKKGWSWVAFFFAPVWVYSLLMVVKILLGTDDAQSQITLDRLMKIIYQNPFWGVGISILMGMTYNWLRLKYHLQEGWTIKSWVLAYSNRNAYDQFTQFTRDQRLLRQQQVEQPNNEPLEVDTPDPFLR